MRYESPQIERVERIEALLSPVDGVSNSDLNDAAAPN
jgi:hypothetical protein